MEFITKYGWRVGVCALLKKNARDSSFAEMIFPQHSLIKAKKMYFLFYILDR